MKRQIICFWGVFAGMLLMGSAITYAQSSFKIPFKFEAGDKSYPPGDYRVSQEKDGMITLHTEPGGEEILLPIVEKLSQPGTPVEEAHLIFDMVGNFEPSYTEYVTEYLLSEVWLSPSEGFLILTTEGDHDHKIIRVQKEQ
jgi:hypothetical protein